MTASNKDTAVSIVYCASFQRQDNFSTEIYKKKI